MYAEKVDQILTVLYAHGNYHVFPLALLVENICRINKTLLHKIKCPMIFKEIKYTLGSIIFFYCLSELDARLDSTATTQFEAWKMIWSGLLVKVPLKSFRKKHNYYISVFQSLFWSWMWQRPTGTSWHLVKNCMMLWWSLTGRQKNSLQSRNVWLPPSRSPFIAESDNSFQRIIIPCVFHLFFLWTVFFYKYINRNVSK